MPTLMNKVSLSFICLIFLLSLNNLAQEISSTKEQIQLALQAAPQELRADASVWGYTEEGALEMLKEGSNHLVCLGDDPGKEGISVACYHKSLEPFMSRGRELKAEGKSRDEVFQTREAEAKNGTLIMPRDPATLFVLSGKEAQFFPEADSLAGANLRYVVYIPFATAESTGLPTQPRVPGEPWIMFPGTHGAHIMVTPPRK